MTDTKVSTRQHAQQLSPSSMLITYSSPATSTQTADSLPNRQAAMMRAREAKRKASEPLSGTLQKLKLSADMRSVAACRLAAVFVAQFKSGASDLQQPQQP
jgi:hypothetical protein